MGSGGCICSKPSIKELKKLGLADTNSRFGRSGSTRDKDRRKEKYAKFDERNQEEASREAVTAIVTSRQKTKEDIANILRVLKNHCIFNNLDSDSQLAILDSVKHYAVGAKEIIFEEGQPGVCFFCVASGKLEVLSHGERTGAIITAGSGFGEIALIEDSVRTATIRTVEPCSLWGLDGKTFNSAIKKLSEMNYQENKRFMQTVPIFNSLTNSQKELMLYALVAQKWSCGYEIVKEGENGDLFYMIKEGTVACFENKVEKRRLGKGDYFGEQALLYNKPRTATIIAVTDVKVVSIGRETLSQVLGSSLDHILYRNSLLMAIDKSQVLKNLNSTQIEALLTNFKIKQYSAGEVIIARGSAKNEKLVILLKGSIRGPLSDIEIHTCIGDLEMLNKDNSEHLVNYIANEDVDIVEITKENAIESIGGELGQVMLNNEATALLRNVQMFKGLSQGKVEELANALKICYFDDCEEIVKQGSCEDSFFIIRAGVVKVFKNQEFIRNIAKHDYFGERAALMNEIRSATVVASGKVECWVLHKNNFIGIINEDIRNSLLKRIEIQDSGAVLTDLVPVKLLGTGKFGIVVQVAHKEKSTNFALKSITRSKVETLGIYENLMLEKNILMQLDHCMIVKMIKTLKDHERIYFLMEYVPGIDLFYVLLKLDVIREETAKFYMACFLLTIEHLHERNIIHRDLKPENVMIDEEGYPKLIDFGTSKIVSGRTYTTLGTPHYISPEIILRKGYNTTVDLWSLGVMLYEIIFGKVPFGADIDDPKSIYESILLHQLDLSASPYPGNYYKGLIQQLLSVNPAARLRGNMENLKLHHWFANYNWERLISRQLKAPYIPKLEEIETGLAETRENVAEFIEKIENSQVPLKRLNSIKEIPKNWDQAF